MEKLRNLKFSDTDDDEQILGIDEQFKIRNEHNEWIDVIGMVTKFDSVDEITFESGNKLRASPKHILAYDKLHTKYLKDCKVGDKIKKADDEFDTIVSINNISNRGKLYDLQVASDTHLYQTSDGLIHHNSIGLVNLSWNYIQQGKDVIYISLELKEAKIIKRYITHSTKIKTFDIPNKEFEIFNHLKKCDEKGYGRFTTHFYQPNTLTSMKLELFIRHYIQKYSTVPVIVVDYAGLMIPNTKGWQGMFERDKYVSEELRGVATLFNTVVWSADQYNRCIAFGETVETPTGKKNIEDIVIGDKVLGTNNEFRLVTDVTEPDEQEVYEITTKSGKKVVVSGRHIFPKYVDGKIIDDNIFCTLKVGDSIYVNGD
jgi:hypothetical protein